MVCNFANVPTIFILHNLFAELLLKLILTSIFSVYSRFCNLDCDAVHVNKNARLAIETVQNLPELKVSIY